MRVRIQYSLALYSSALLYWWCCLTSYPYFLFMCIFAFFKRGDWDFKCFLAINVALGHRFYRNVYDLICSSIQCESSYDATLNEAWAWIAESHSCAGDFHAWLQKHFWNRSRLGSINRVDWVNRLFQRLSRSCWLWSLELRFRAPYQCKWIEQVWHEFRSSASQKKNQSFLVCFHQAEEEAKLRSTLEKKESLASLLAKERQQAGTQLAEKQARSALPLSCYKLQLQRATAAKPETLSILVPH